MKLLGNPSKAKELAEFPALLISVDGKTRKFGRRLSRL